MCVGEGAFYFRVSGLQLTPQLRSTAQDPTMQHHRAQPEPQLLAQKDPKAAPHYGSLLLYHNQPNYHIIVLRDQRMNPVPAMNHNLGNAPGCKRRVPRRCSMNGLRLHSHAADSESVLPSRRPPVFGNRGPPRRTRQAFLHELRA